MLRLVRRKFTEQSTIGDLYADNLWECFTLEDRTREGPKVPGRTAIPEGIYRVTIDFSARFQKYMPHVLDVPNFSGIRIHSGNVAEDTEGCILVGKIEQDNRIGSSRVAFDALLEKIRLALRTENVFIAVTHAQKEVKSNAQA